MTTYIFYHMMSPTTPCPDGIFAAGVAYRRFGDNAKYHGCCYIKAGDRPPEADIPQPSDMVYVLDFSFEAWVLAEWTNRGVSFKIIDHHENKMLELLGKRELTDMIVFDNNKCGAILAWEYFFSQERIPAILYYIDDRDRWQHKLPYTKEIHAAVGALGRNFDLVKMLLPLSQDQLINVFSKLGARELELKEKIIAELCNKYQLVTIGDYLVPTVYLDESDPKIPSDICSYLFKQFTGFPVAACYYKEGNKEKWELRSNGDFDVSELARSFGGDGHKSAAGFIR